MKILLVSTSSGSRGGGELSLLYLARSLAARGHEVALWVSTHARMDELATAFAEIGAVHRSAYTNTYDRRGRSIAAWLDRSTAHRVADEWRALAPDVLHINKQNLEDGLDLLRAAALSKIPGISMIHITQSAAYLQAKMAWIRDWTARASLTEFAGPLVTNPESRRRDLAEFLGDDRRVRMIVNGVPIHSLETLRARRTAVRSELGVAASELLVIAVGRMEEQKRPLLFLERAACAAELVPDARFIWVGDGSLTDVWDEWVAKRGLASIIRRLPWQKDVPAFMGAADVFMHTAGFEGLAFAPLEAMAAGLPLAITPNILDEIPHLPPGAAIAIGDDDSWCERLKNRAALAATGATLREVAERHFSYDSMAASYEALYRETMQTWK